MRLGKFSILGLSGSFLFAVSWLPGCSAEPQGIRAPGGAAGMMTTPAAGSTTTPMGGSGGSGGDVTATGGTGGEIAGTGGGGTGGGLGGGGTGGTGGSGGGTAGTGGYGGFTYGGTTSAPERTCAKAEGDDALLDDFEDSNTSIHAIDGRNGSWTTNKDATVGGSFVGTAPSASSGTMNSVGWCSTVSGYTDWGANIVLKPLAPVCGYDASKYLGICFDVKGSLEAGSGPVEFGVGTADTVPDADGGACVTNCWYNYMAELTLTNAYQEVCFDWADLTQWSGTPETAQFELDAESIVQLEWKFTDRDAGGATEGELCIDNVRFKTE
jgi:hypothetical protein